MKLFKDQEEKNKKIKKICVNKRKKQKLISCFFVSKKCNNLKILANWKIYGKHFLTSLYDDFKQLEKELRNGTLNEKRKRNSRFGSIRQI